MTGKELWNIAQANVNGHMAGDGPYTKRCHSWLEHRINTSKALLTHSCTAALEMAAILLDAGPGDEIIMPSYNFVSAANAFVLRGATPVFVDIRPDTLNIDETKIESAITAKTKAIIPVHYAGVGCEMDTIMSIANKYDLFVIEDAAQGILSSYNQRPLGSIGHMGTLSFHETKNIISGEGGALLINDPRFVERAEIIREKGTNRSQFFRGKVDKYTWVDIGSSFLPGEIIAAFLHAQIEESDEITRRRLEIWHTYQDAFEPRESDQMFRCPVVPANCEHNAHMYYLLMPDREVRKMLIEKLAEKGISTVFHYVPLHSSPAGKKYGRFHGEMNVTDSLAERIIRLPLWIGIEKHLDFVIENILLFLESPAVSKTEITQERSA